MTLAASHKRKRAGLLAALLCCVPLAAIGQDAVSFEDAGDWTSSPANLATVAAPVTDGQSALAVPMSGSRTITSRELVLGEDFLVGTDPQKISIDLFVPSSHTSWIGYIELILKVPSANLWWENLGRVNLAGLPKGEYVTHDFNLTANARNALLSQGPATLIINLNANAGPDPWYLDHLRVNGLPGNSGGTITEAGDWSERYIDIETPSELHAPDGWPDSTVLEGYDQALLTAEFVEPGLWTLTGHAKGTALVTARCQVGDQPLEQTFTVQVFDPAYPSLLGFESAEDWNTQDTVLSAARSPDLVQGQFALEVPINGYTRLTSDPLSPSTWGITLEPDDKLRLRARLPQDQSGWVGTIDVVLRAPSASMYWEALEQHDFANNGVFEVFEFELTDAARAALISPDVDDMEIIINVNGASGASPYVLDFLEIGTAHMPDPPTPGGNSPTDFDLGPAQTYNAFLFENFAVSSSSTHGRVAAGGDVTLANYSLADQITDDPPGASLVVGGNLTFSGGSVHVGDILVAGSVSVDSSVSNGMAPGAQIVENAELPVDFSASETALTELSERLAGFASNGTVDFSYSGLHLVGDGEADLQIFMLYGNQLRSASSLSIEGIPDNAHILINVSGAASGLTNMGMDSLSAFRNRTLFNFFEATSLQFSGIGIQGSVLAPLAAIDNPMGSLSGTVVAQSWTGPMSLAHEPFIPYSGTSLTPPEFISEPVTEAYVGQNYTYPAEAISDRDSALTYELVVGPEGMGVSLLEGLVTWLPQSAQTGVVFVTLRATDAENLSTTQTFEIEVIQPNRPPTAQAQMVETPQDQALAVTLTGSDPDNDGLDFAIAQQPAHGSLSGTPPEVIYTPATGFYGDDSFTFTVNDGESDSDPATISISIIPRDSDGDGIPDDQDNDRDGDGVPDAIDAFPDDPAESADQDGDGIGDNADTDRDGDGVENGEDAFPDDPAESSDQDGDGIGDNADTDRDGDGIENDADLFPDDPTESADQDGDGIGDNADPDRDGDGADNVDDTYPDDPSRYQLGAPQTPVANQEEQTLVLVWAAPADSALVAGYYVYRRPYDSETAQRLNSEPVANLTYTDTAVSNGAGYWYHITAVDSQGREGEPSAEAPGFIAYNQQSISDLALERQGPAAQLDWSASAEVDRYRVYRQIPGDEPEQLVDIADPNYSDAEPDWRLAYEYRVSTLIDFDQPFTGEIVTVESPLSEAVTLEPLAPLAISFDNAREVSSGEWLQILSGATSADVTGEYSQATAPPELVFEHGSDTVSLHPTGGRFAITLPVGDSAQTWQVSLREPAFTDREITLSLKLAPDGIAPLVSIDGGARDTTADTIVLTGQAVDQEGEVVEVFATSDRFADLQVQASLGSGFQLEFPLQSGLNLITVHAVDDSGNVGQAQVEVTRQVGVVPEIRILSPAQGARFSQELITVTGVVYSTQVSGELRLTLGGQVVFPTAHATEANTHSFRFDDVRLVEGTNVLQITATSPGGTSQASVAVVRGEDEGGEEAGGPSLQITEPRTQRVFAQSPVLIAGRLQGEVAPLSLLVNSDTVPLSFPDRLDSGFEYLADVPGDGTPAEFVLIATDGLGRVSEQRLTLSVDSGAPIIELDNAFSEPPTVNHVLEYPLRVHGRVTDTELTGFEINGEITTLTPSGNEGEFLFDHPVAVMSDTPQTLSLVAWDRAGNRTEVSYEVQAQSDLRIEFVQPRADATLSLPGATTTLPITLRLAGTVIPAQLTVRMDDGAPITLNNAGGDLWIGEWPLSAGFAGDHHLAAQALDESAQPLASAQADFTLIDEDALELSLARSEPGNGDIRVAPTVDVQLFFNRPVDTSLFGIQVRETVHGMDYLPPHDSGGDFPLLDNQEPVEVHRDQEPVGGELAWAPDRRSLGFLPERDFAYGAAVFIDVLYDGTTISRYQFQIRPTPTLVQGMVASTGSAPLAGIKVSVPELGLVTRTDNNGLYGFGFGADAEPIFGGRYLIRVNPDREVFDYGEFRTWASLQDGRFNRLGMTRLPQLSRQIPERQVASGMDQARLDDGNLLLDLSDAQLRFPGLRTQGLVHVQFMPAEQLLVRRHPAVAPQWLYAFQPQGISVDGELGLDIKLPGFFGDTAYLPPNQTLVLLVGRDEDSLLLAPVGVGVIENGRLRALRSEFSSLDYLGYSLRGVTDDSQALLQAYVDGEVQLYDLSRQLGQ